VTRRGYHCRGQPGSAQGKPALLARQNPNWLPSLLLPDQGQSQDFEIGSIGGKTKIAEVNLLGLTGDLDGTLTPRVVKTIETLLAQDLASGRPVNTGGGSSGQQYRTYHALGQPSAKGIMLEPRRPASRGSADQRRFANRGIRIVTLALGGDLGTDLGCTAIIMPSAHFYSCPSNDRGASSSDTSRQCYSTPPSVHQERTP
jgi:hypothetical protein